MADGSATITETTHKAILNFHLEPSEPLEVSELTSALGSVARQYQQFASESKITSKLADARLLVSNVKPGSIDINFIPDYSAAMAVAAPMIPLLYDKFELLTKFAERLRNLLNLFLGKESTASAVTIKDCDDALNIVNPIAQHGGHQTINIHKGDIVNNILSITAADAKQIVEASTHKRAELSAASAESKQRVAMVWTQLARDAAKVTGEKSPDKGLIEEIDGKARPIFFTDEMAYLKREMIDDEQNPYRKVFFVDVEISRVPGGRVGNYRIVGYHGKEDRDDDPTLPPSSGADNTR